MNDTRNIMKTTLYWWNKEGNHSTFYSNLQSDYNFLSQTAHNCAHLEATTVAQRNAAILGDSIRSRLTTIGFEAGMTGGRRTARVFISLVMLAALRGENVVIKHMLPSSLVTSSLGE